MSRLLAMLEQQPGWMLGLWALLTLATLGMAPLFDYDETIYAQTAIDMMHHGEWIVPIANGTQFFEKPPFTYYMMDLCFALFGDNAFAARLPSALFTLATAALLLHFGTRLHSRRLGAIAAMAYLCMLEVGFLAHAAILDPVLNFFVAACLLNYLLWQQEKSRRHALWSAAMMGLAVSIKGPVGAVVPLLIIVAERLVSGRLWQLLKEVPWLPATTLFVLTAIPWYLMILIMQGPGFLYEFIWVHNIGRALKPMQGHGGGWHYYLVVFAVSVLPLLACMPWVAKSCWRERKGDDVFAMVARLSLLWVALVILLFTFAQTKLPHYISSIYPAVALALAAAWVRRPPDAAGNTVIATLALLLPVSLLLIALPWVYPYLQELVHHPRAVAILKQDIHPGMMIPLLGILLLAALVWLGRQRRSPQWLLHLIVVGLVLQFSLLTGLGTFASRLMQAPTMHIAEVMHQTPAELPFYSFNLNAPSASFYAGRNYRLLQQPQEFNAIRQSGHPFALMLRSEALSLLPWLKQYRPVVDQGGFLLYIVRPENRVAA